MAIWEGSGFEEIFSGGEYMARNHSRHQLSLGPPEVSRNIVFAFLRTEMFDL